MRLKLGFLFRDSHSYYVDRSPRPDKVSALGFQLHPPPLHVISCELNAKKNAFLFKFHSILLC